jgi:CRP-like cAMP-binding protein/di/tricarboxylate transporter
VPVTDTARPEDLLTRVGLFSTLGRVELAKLAAYLEPVEVQTGREVFRQGEAGDSLYIVTEGALGVFVASGDGRSALRVSTLAPGDLFGEMALFTGEPRSATVLADRPSTVLQLPRERFLLLVRREPAISLTIVATLSERLRTANQARVEHADFVAAAIEQALRRLPGERREAVLEASLLETMTPAGLRALFGSRAEPVAADLAALGVDGSAGRVTVRGLREWFERELGLDGVSARASSVAARLAHAGFWNDALGVLARVSTPALFAETLGRALRAVPALDADHARRWIERVDDDRASRNGDLALTRALLHEARGDAPRALGVLRRALGVALVGTDPATGQRLAAEIARLSNSRAADVAVGLRPASDTPPSPGWRRLPALLSLGAAGLATVIAAWPGAGALWTFVWLLATAIALLMSRVVPDFAVALALITGWVLLGVAKTPAALAGFASKEWLFVVATYGLAAATARSGLLYRIGLLLVRRLPHGVIWQTATLLLTGLVLTPLVPSSTGRASLTSPLALAVAEALRLPERGRSAALLGLGTWVGSGPLMFAFLNGSGTCLLAWGLLPEASRARFSWVGWFVAAAPLAVGLAVASLVVLRAMLRPEPVAELPLRRVSLQVAMLGPVAPREMGTIAILVVTVGGWVAAPWLGLDLATVALLGLLATVALGTFDRVALQSLDWSFLIFFGTVLTVGRLGATVGLDRAAAATVDRLLGTAQPGPLLFVLTVAGVSLVTRLVLDQDLTVVLVGITLLPVASRVGVEPWVVVIALLATSVAWFLPSQTPSYLVAQSASEGRLFSHEQAQRFAVAYAALTLLGLALSVPYWRLLGLV